MANEFRMPSLGPDMESGTLVEWRVKPGDAVKRGDIVALVETDKGVIDVETFVTGVVKRLLVSPGAHVPVGAVLAQFSGEQSTTTAVPQAEASPPQPVRVPVEAEPAIAAPIQLPPLPAPAARQKVSPAARVRARELSIDLANVTGTGTGSVITVDDVNEYASRAARSQPPPPGGRPSDMRQVIARAMSRSKREIPHYYLSVTCNFLAARTWLEQHNAAASIEERLLPSALLLKSVARAARAMPEFNGFYRESAFTPSSEVHVGMAIAMRGGRLVAPAILDADQKTLNVIMRELRDLTTRVRAGHMRASELAMSTITLTSLAEEGVDLIVPAIYPPQVAIVGAGSIQERPWIIDGLLRAAPLVTLTLAADHRVTDGRAGARFLAHLRDALQSPEAL